MSIGHSLSIGQERVVGLSRVPTLVAIGMVAFQLLLWESLFICSVKSGIWGFGSMSDS